MKNSPITIPFILLIIALLGTLGFSFFSNYKIVRIAPSNIVIDSSKQLKTAGKDSAISKPLKKAISNQPDVQFATNKIPSYLLLDFAYDIADKCDENDYTKAYVYSAYNQKFGFTYNWQLIKAVSNIPYNKEYLDAICQKMRNDAGMSRDYMMENLISIGMVEQEAEVMSNYIFANYSRQVPKSDTVNKTSY